MRVAPGIRYASVRVPCVIRSFVVMRLPFSALLYPLPSSTLLCPPLPSSALLCPPLPSSTLLYPLPSSTLLYPPLPSSALLPPLPFSTASVRVPCVIWSRLVIRLCRTSSSRVNTHCLSLSHTRTYTYIFVHVCVCGRTCARAHTHTRARAHTHIHMHKNTTCPRRCQQRQGRDTRGDLARHTNGW